MLTFEYQVVCDEDQLYQFDLSAYTLFAIATLTIFIAHHTPELELTESLSDEEREGLDFKPKHAFVFCGFSSCMLFTLYMLINYIAPILEVIVTLVSALAL